jgi:hypothetical protein
MIGKRGLAMSRLEGLLVLLLALAYAIYGSVFISQTLFTYQGVTYSSLFDDPMISMTYARNLARGDGLVWNAGGERVEGYTNPLWVGLMAVFHLLPIPIEWTSLAVQIAGLVFMVACAILTYVMARDAAGGSLWASLGAAALTIFYYPLTRWALHGNEVAVLLLVMPLATLMAFRASTDHPARGLFLLLGISTLVRLDMLVPFLVILGWMLVFEPARRWSNLLWGVGILVVFVGAQTLWRLWYYGYPLPATYYLKMTGFSTHVRIQHGWDVFVEFLISLKWFLVPVPLLALLFRRDRKTVLLALLMLGWGAYSIYVGGDAWEHRGGANRFISLGMSAFFTLFSIAAWESVQRGRRVLSEIVPGLHKLAAIVALLAFVGICALGWLYPNRLTTVGAFSYSLPHEKGGLRHSLRHPRSGLLGYALLLRPSSFVPPSARYVRDGLIVRELTNEQAKIAVAGAGSTIYFAGRQGIDLYGKSDMVIAEAPPSVAVTRETFKPGHNKFNYHRSLTELKPDVVVDLIFGYRDYGEQIMSGAYRKVDINGHSMYLRKDSPHIRWDRVSMYTRE